MDFGNRRRASPNEKPGERDPDVNYAYTRGDGGDEIDNISQHKLNAGVNIRAHRNVNTNLRVNWRGRIRAPTSNIYHQPKSEATIAALGYDYETETDPDGFMEGHLVVNATITGMELGGLRGLQPQLIVRNLLGEDYLQMGRQSGSGARPAGMLQPEIQNPSGFIPPYTHKRGNSSRDVYDVPVGRHPPDTGPDAGKSSLSSGHRLHSSQLLPKLLKLRLQLSGGEVLISQLACHGGEY